MVSALLRLCRGHGAGLAGRVAARDVIPDVETGPAWMPDGAGIVFGSLNQTRLQAAAGAVGGLPTMHQLKVTLAGSPMVTYLYDATGSVTLAIDAKAGSDTLTITGGPDNDTTPGASQDGARVRFESNDDAGSRRTFAAIDAPDTSGYVASALCLPERRKPSLWLP